MVWVVSLLTAELIPRGLTPEIIALVFGVWFGEVPGKGPHPIQSLYPHCLLPEASPKAISERTSYLLV